MRYWMRHINNRVIIRIDYSGLKPVQMISLFDEVQELIISQDKEVFLMVNFSRCYVDKKFSSHSRRGFLQVRNQVSKIAFLGLNFPKYQMVNAYAFLWSVNFRAFSNAADALNYLLE